MYHFSLRQSRHFFVEGLKFGALSKGPHLTLKFLFSLFNLLTWVLRVVLCWYFGLFMLVLCELYLCLKVVLVNPV